MAKTATVTITGKVGPGNTVTSLVLRDVKSINFQVANNTIQIVYGDKTQQFDYNATATVTYTISGSAATITIA